MVGCCKRVSALVAWLPFGKPLPPSLPLKVTQVVKNLKTGPAMLARLIALARVFTLASSGTCIHILTTVGVIINLRSGADHTTKQECGERR